MDADLIQRLGEQCAGPIRFGVDDCLHVAADMMREWTGVDILASHRPGEITAEQAGAIVGENRGLVRFMLRQTRALDRVPPSRGQIGLARIGSIWAACFPLGNGWWAARTEDGLTILGESEVGRAWRCRS